MARARSHRVTARAVACVAVVAAVGCSRESNRAECERAREAARSAAVAGDIVSGRQKLAHAREVCDEKREYDFARIEKLLDERAEKEKRTRERAAREAALDREQPLRAFMRFVDTERDSTKRRVSGTECVERGHEHFGWCVSKAPGTVGGKPASYRVRYHSDEPLAVRFEVDAPVQLECSDLGSHIVLRSWKREVGGAQRTRAYCRLSEPKLRGLEAYVDSGRADGTVMVFSREFADRRAEFMDRLRDEGR